MSVTLSGSVSGWYPKTKIVVFENTGNQIAESVVNKQKPNVTDSDFPIPFSITSQYLHNMSNLVFDSGRGLVARCDALSLGS